MNDVFAWQEAPAADFAVIGDPIGHSKSPQMHHAAYAALGRSYRYVSIHVPAGEVAAALAHLTELGYQGVNVTVPHKGEAFTWSQIVAPHADRLEAVNTLRLATREATNTDQPAFETTLLEANPPDGPVLLLGAGGTARAVAAALRELGRETVVYNRTQAKGAALAEEFGLAGTVSLPHLPGAAVVVNTTSAALQGEAVAVDWDNVQPDALAYDVSYGSNLTPFLEAAARAGRRTRDGKAMLAEQGALALEWWLGVEAPRRAMLEALG